MKVVEPLVLVLLTKSLSNQYLFQKQNSPENGEFFIYYINNFLTLKFFETFMKIFRPYILGGLFHEKDH